MCMMCEGADLDDVLFHIDGLVRRQGWALVPVEGSPGRPGWVYTVGLADHDHPELVIAGVDLEFATAILNYLAECVCDGERLDVCDRVTCSETTLDVGLVDVHPAHVERGLINVWLTYYRALGLPEPVPWARQVILPDSHYCTEHQGSQLRLDRAADVMHTHGPNRAVRRAQQRRARRGRR